MRRITAEKTLYLPVYVEADVEFGIQDTWVSRMQPDLLFWPLPATPSTSLAVPKEQEQKLLKLG